VARVLGGEHDARTPLHRHLDRFKEYALGVACAGGSPCRFETPVVVETPFAIPATPYLVDGAARVALRGAERRALVVDVDDGEARVSLDGTASRDAPVHIRRCAAAHAGGHEWWLHPSALAREGWDKAEPASAAGHAYQAAHVDLVERTIESIADFAPDRFDAFHRSIRMFALKPRDQGGFDDFSEPALPGSFVASAVPNHWALADHFIHELQHNRLSFVEECGALLEAGDDATGYYSPWRDNARSLYGVFHGVYVFLGVYAYWRTVHDADAADPARRDYAGDRVVRLPLQLELARRLLERHARLAPLGRGLLDQLGRDIDALRAGAARDGHPVDAPAFVATDDGAFERELSRLDGRPLTVREALAEHAAHHEASAQCVGLVDDLVATAVEAAR
jgi:HEXXH motif-containing protein